MATPLTAKPYIANIGTLAMPQPLWLLEGRQALGALHATIVKTT